MPQVVLKDVVFSYVNVFEPRKMDEDSPAKYSCRILIDKKNAVALKAAKAAIDAAIDEGIGKGYWTKAMKSSLKIPLRDGDEELKAELQKGPEHEGRIFFNANAREDSPPGVVKPVGGKPVPIDDPLEFFSGCIGHAYISFYPFKTKNSKGVAAGLNGCYKLREGERLDNRVPASTVFAEFAETDENLDEDFGSDNDFPV